MNTIKPTEPKYKGYRFRSCLEARWAVFFDGMGIEWGYETQGYQLSNGACYLPDFFLTELKIWVEVKPTKPSNFNELQNVVRFSFDQDEPLLLILGYPGEHSIYLIDNWFDPTFLTNKDSDDFYKYFDNQDRALEEFIRFAEENRRVNFGMIPLQRPKPDGKKIQWRIVHEIQPYYFRKTIAAAANAARSARFEFGESGKSKGVQS